MIQIMKQAGCVRIYDRESYADSHGGKSPEDDGLRKETMIMPDGSKKDVYKVLRAQGSDGSREWCSRCNDLKRLV